MDFSNTALIQEDVLANIALVLEAGWPVGPLFMHSLGALVEAAVIHDKVYFDPFRATQRADIPKGSLQELLQQSTFVRELVLAGVINYFPPRGEIDACLRASGSTYTTREFVAVYQRGRTTFTPISPEQEPVRYRILANVVDLAPQIFMNESTTFNLAVSGGPNQDVDLGLQSNLLARLMVGLDGMEWAMLTGQNSTVRALTEITGHLGLNLYLSALAFPHQIGGVRLNNQRARAIYDKMVGEVVAVDADEVGLTAFSRVPVPPLLQTALQRCGDSPDALAEQIVALRDEHSRFRHSLTDLERSYATASTRRQQDELNDLFTNSFAAILAQARGPKYHLIYPLWDILTGLITGGPRRAIKDASDKALERRRKLSVMGRMRGTHDFYEALRDSPPNRENVRLVKKVFPAIMGDDVWHLAGDLGRRVEQHLVKQPPA